jgi:hypothetical protein
MAEVLLFHHAQGQTTGFHAFANELRRAGHAVHAPDPYDGRTFATLDEGLAYAKHVGFGKLIEPAVRVSNGLPKELVYAGFVGEGDLAAARALAGSTDAVELPECGNAVPRLSGTAAAAPLP